LTGAGSDSYSRGPQIILEVVNLVAARYRRRRPGEQTQVVDGLTKRFGKYALVVGVAKRAQDLKERIDSAIEPSSGGLVDRAIREIARGEVKIRGEEPEEEPD
jgi:DNA-directed RNA polymerase subunit K/omega